MKDRGRGARARGGEERARGGMKDRGERGGVKDRGRGERWSEG